MESSGDHVKAEVVDAITIHRRVVPCAKTTSLGQEDTGVDLERRAKSLSGCSVAAVDEIAASILGGDLA